MFSFFQVRVCVNRRSGFIRCEMAVSPCSWRWDSRLRFVRRGRRGIVSSRGAGGSCRVSKGANVLVETIEPARQIVASIELAAPGGLGALGGAIKLRPFGRRDEEDRA